MGIMLNKFRFKKSGPSCAVAQRLLLCVAAVFLAACGSSAPKPKPLVPIKSSFAVGQAWSARVGGIDFPLVLHVKDSTVFVASGDGTVAAFNADSGAELWRIRLKERITAAIGSDGEVTSVATHTNEVVALAGGSELWRQKLTAPVYTPPLVAGGRVFVLAADRVISAFDAHDGAKLWSRQNPTNEPLVLSQAGVLMAVRDTLVTGLSGRLMGINPDDGRIVWQVPVANPRGTNDVERLVDMVWPVSREGDDVCARAFQAMVGCVDTAAARLRWSKSAQGAQGIAGNEDAVFGSESNGELQAWQRDTGDRLWTNDTLLYRKLSAPLTLGRSVIVGDESGNVHLFSRTNGAPLNRLTTDGSAIQAAPILAGNTLVVVTRKGGIYGFRPQ